MPGASICVIIDEAKSLFIIKITSNGFDVASCLKFEALTLSRSSSIFSLDERWVDCEQSLKKGGDIGLIPGTNCVPEDCPYGKCSLAAA